MDQLERGARGGLFIGGVGLLFLVDSFVCYTFGIPFWIGLVAFFVLMGLCAILSAEAELRG